MQSPYLIDFTPIGNPSIGYISVAEQSGKIPFEIKRVYWTYHTPESVVRGRHAHYKTEQILIAATGRIIVNLEFPDKEEISTYVLDKSSTGLYIPPMVWHTMQYSHTAIQVVLASTEYDESDYIRSYEVFKKQLINQVPS